MSAQRSSMALPREFIACDSSSDAKSGGGFRFLHAASIHNLLWPHRSGHRSTADGTNRVRAAHCKHPCPCPTRLRVRINIQQSAGDFSSVDLHPPTDIPTAGQLRGVRATCGSKDLLHSRIQRTTTVTETSEQHRSRMRCFSCLWRCILRAPFTPILSDDTCDNFLVQKCREARRASIYNLVGHRQNANAFHPVRELV